MQKIFVMIGVISFAVSVYGQAPLTLQDAIQIGLDNSKSLKISELNVEAAQEKSIEVNANRWASLAFKGGYTRLSTIPSFNLDIPAYSLVLVFLRYRFLIRLLRTITIITISNCSFSSLYSQDFSLKIPRRLRKEMLKLRFMIRKQTNLI